MNTHSAVDEVRDRLKPFTYHLLGMEPRIRLHEFLDDLDDENFFTITKEHIYSPYQFPPIEHEICHLLEMRNEKRWLLSNQGMETYTDLNLISAKSFFAGLARELRVRAIQLHMMPEELDNKNGCVYNILNNQLTWGQYAALHLPFGRFKTYQDVEDWAGLIREKTYKAWSQDRIVHEWKIRLDYIRDYMES